MFLEYMARNPGGRPKQSVLKTRYLRVRLTDEEYNSLLNNAKQQHYSTISSYVHHRLFSRNFSKNVHTFSFQDAIRIEEVYKEIAKCGVNINQVAKKINSLREEIDDSILIYEVKKLQEILSIVEINSQEIYKLLIEKTKDLYHSENDTTEEIK